MSSIYISGKSRYTILRKFGVLIGDQDQENEQKMS